MTLMHHAIRDREETGRELSEETGSEYRWSFRRMKREYFSGYQFWNTNKKIDTCSLIIFEKDSTTFINKHSPVKRLKGIPELDSRDKSPLAYKVAQN